MKKRELLKRLGTNRAIADILGISVQAVTKWRAYKRIPKEREEQLRKLRPELFEKTV